MTNTTEKPTLAELWSEFEDRHETAASILLWLAKAWGFVLLAVGIIGGLIMGLLAIVGAFVSTEYGWIFLGIVLITIGLACIKGFMVLLETTDSY